MNPDSFLKQRLICVAVIDQPDTAVHLAEALLEGGLNVIEITFRTAGAAECIANIRNSVPGMMVGAGTRSHPNRSGRRWRRGRNLAFRPA